MLIRKVELSEKDDKMRQIMNSKAFNAVTLWIYF